MTTGERRMSAFQASGSWNTEELQHHFQDEEVRSPSVRSPSARSPSARLGRHSKDGGKPSTAQEWGHPGHLTKEEVDVFVKFRDEIEKRDAEFRNTIFSFGEIEGEAFTLCRWLRARKFKYDDVIKMVEEATLCRATARSFDFYPDAALALGVDPSVFISQYPQLYTGVAKNGCPLFISKPGVLNVDGIECITTIDGILRLHWHVMMHDYAGRLKKNKEKNPEFTRFECVSVLDLDQLTSSQLSSRTLNIVKVQAAIDSLCFPETMNKMVIVNAPRFFSFTWRIIKSWLDPRTASKIEVISNRSAGEKRLRELVDDEQLPSDYGGKGEDTTTTLIKSAPGGMTRMLTDLMRLRSHQSYLVELKAGEELDVHVYTRGVVGATFSITDASSKALIKSDIDIIHKGDPSNDNDPPTHVKLTPSRITGPANIKIKANTKGGRFSSENFLVVCDVFPTV